MNSQTILIQWLGKKLYPYLEGYFGDNYEEKTIEAIGNDWVVVRNDNGEVDFASFNNSEEMIQCLIRLSNENREQ